MREESPWAGTDHPKGSGRPTGDSNLPPLLTSKLAIPSVPDRLVDRPRLRRRLDAGCCGAVTLVAGPAGWGKTALLGSWARAADPARRVAWLSVERGDGGNPFWSYLHAALAWRGARDNPDSSSLPAPGHAPDEVYLARLADALARLEGPVTLVLDDLHNLEDTGVLRGIEFLLRHADPHLRLVIGARADPALALHRWRLNGDLAELGTTDLAFTPAETAELMAQHGLTLPHAELAQLQAHTEGWPAGLRLAALAIQRRPDPPLRAADIAGDDQGIADYLIEEVLARQPAEIRDVLLRTSIVDRIFAELVNTLTARADGERLLADLERRNTFVIPLGTHPPSYRYHRMFGELLRAELRRRCPETIPELHRRAAAWYADHDQPVDALRHALAGEDWSHAIAVLLGHWHELVLGGHGASPYTLVPSPPPPDAVRADPELALAYAAVGLALDDVDTAHAYLKFADRHQHLLTEERRERFTLITTAFHLAEAQRGSDIAKALAIADRMLLLARRNHPTRDRPPDDRARAIALAALGAARLNVGDLATAEITLADALAGAERAGLACPRLACLSRLAFLRAVRGELSAADRIARAAVGEDPCPSQSRPIHCAYAYLALAIVELQRNRLDDAESQLNRAIWCRDISGGPALAPSLAVVRGELLHARGDLTGGYEALRAGRRELTGWRPPPYLEDWFAAVEAELRIAVGDTETVRRSLSNLVDEGGTPLLAVVLARAHLHDHDPHAAARLLPAWADDPTLPLILRLDAGIVEAQLARWAGDQRRVSRVLEHLLRLADPEDIRHPFTRTGPGVREMLVDHLDSGTAYWSLVSQLTDATAPGAAPGAPAPTTLPEQVAGEPLTDRELTVLRYLQSILSNVEIASELRLSVNTVKTHVRSIYRKLNAKRRRDAVRRARELHLL